MLPPPYHRCLHFLGTRFYCSVLLRLHRSFNVSIGLDGASFPSRWAYPYFHCFLYSALATGLGSSSHPNFFFFFLHTVAFTRRRTGECGKSTRIRQFSHPLRSTVTRLITAPCKSSSGRCKIYLVLRYCLFHVPNPDLHTISFATVLARG